MASVPSVTSRQRPSGDVTPPGYRQAMPMMAIGSSDAVDPAVSFACSPGPAPDSCSRRCRTTSRGVGWS